MRRSISVLCLTIAVALGGCAHQRFSGDLYALSEPYRVGSGDRLRIIVYGQDSLSNSYSVDATGQISMPLIGFVPVNGFTPHEVEQAVESRLRAGFLREPKVSAEVEAYRPFFILGEVTTPGQYPYVNGMTVQNAVAIAGGFTPRGYQGAATMTRTVEGQPVTGDVPIVAPVKPGDTIVIRERFF
jgi:polysaccharide export outer membrane protein